MMPDRTDPTEIRDSSANPGAPWFGALRFVPVNAEVRALAAGRAAGSAPSDPFDRRGGIIVGVDPRDDGTDVRRLPPDVAEGPVTAPRVSHYSRSDSAIHPKASVAPLAPRRKRATHAQPTLVRTVQPCPQQLAVQLCMLLRQALVPIHAAPLANPLVTFRTLVRDRVNAWAAQHGRYNGDDRPADLTSGQWEDGSAGGRAAGPASKATVAGSDRAGAPAGCAIRSPPGGACRGGPGHRAAAGSGRDRS